MEGQNKVGNDYSKIGAKKLKPSVVALDKKKLCKAPLKKNKLKVDFEPISYTNVKIEEFLATLNSPVNDRIIVFREEKIPVSKVILAETCWYFQKLFSPHFRDCKSDNFNIDFDVSVTTFKQILDYLKTGTIQLSTINLAKVTKTASFLLLEDLLEFCLDIYKKHMDCTSVNFAHTFADAYLFDDLSKAAFDFKVKNFEAVWRSGVFRSWKLQYMQKILRSDLVVVSEEKKVLQFLFEWLTADLEKRRENAPGLLQNIRFSYLSKENIDEVSGDNAYSQLVNQLEISQLFSGKAPRVYHKGIYILVAEDEWRFQKYWPEDGTLKTLQPPNQISVEVLLDGNTTEGDSSEDLSNWRKRYFFDIVVNNEKIYAIHTAAWGEFKSNTFQVYDPLKDIWEPRASIGRDMQQLKTACSFKNEIYAFYEYESGKLSIKTACVIYSIETDTWRPLPVEVPDFLQRHCGFSGTACGDSIYFVPLDRDYATSFIQYTPSTQVLNTFSCPPSSYGEYRLVAFKSKILFTCGRTNVLQVFCTKTKDFKRYRCNDRRPTPSHVVRTTLFNENIHFVRNTFHDHRITVDKIDPVFMDGVEDPFSLPLPDWKFDIVHILNGEVQIVSLG